MTTMTQTKTDIRANEKPGIFIRTVRAILAAERRYRDQQKLMRTSDEHLKDMGITRLNANGQNYLHVHRG